MEGAARLAAQHRADSPGRSAAKAARSRGLPHPQHGAAVVQEERRSRSRAGSATSGVPKRSSPSVGFSFCGRRVQTSSAGTRKMGRSSRRWRLISSGNGSGLAGAAEEDERGVAPRRRSPASRASAERTRRQPGEEPGEPQRGAERRAAATAGPATPGRGSWEPGGAHHEDDAAALHARSRTARAARPVRDADGLEPAVEEARASRCGHAGSFRLASRSHRGR